MYRGVSASHYSGGVHTQTTYAKLVAAMLSKPYPSVDPSRSLKSRKTSDLYNKRGSVRRFYIFLLYLDPLVVPKGNFDFSLKCSLSFSTKSKPHMLWPAAALIGTIFSKKQTANVYYYKLSKEYRIF